VSAWYGVLIDMKIPLVVTIIPGNRYFGHTTEKFIFQQLLPLGAEGREGQLHREAFPHFCWLPSSSPNHPNFEICHAIYSNPRNEGQLLRAKRTQPQLKKGSKNPI